MHGRAAEPAAGARARPRSPPPRRRGSRRTGAQSPLFRLRATVSAGAASSASGTPSATAAFGEPRAVEMRPRRRAASRASRRDQHRAARARVRVLEDQRAAPPRRARPGRAARRSVSQSPSLTRMWASGSTPTRSPGRRSARAARAGSPGVQVGDEDAPPPCRAARRRAARARRRSRPRRRRPAEPRRAHRRPTSRRSGGAQKSERRSIIRPRQVPPGPRAGVLAVRDHGDAVHEHLVDALDVGERVARASSRRRAGRGRSRRRRRRGRARSSPRSLKPEVLRRHARHLPDRLLERQRPAARRTWWVR